MSELSRLSEIEERFHALAREMAARIPEDDRPPDLDRKMRFVSDVIAGFLFRLPTSAPTDATADELTDELVLLLLGYLRESGLEGWLASLSS